MCVFSLLTFHYMGLHFVKLSDNHKPPSTLILSLLLFTIRNKNQFQVNSEIHQTNTRQRANLHQPSVNASKYQKGVHCIGVKVFNMLLFYVKQSLIIQKNLKHCYKNHHHHWLKSPWWTLAFLRSFAHSSLLRAAFFQLLTPSICVS